MVNVKGWWALAGFGLVEKICKLVNYKLVKIVYFK